MPKVGSKQVPSINEGVGVMKIEKCKVNFAAGERHSVVTESEVPHKVS